MLLVATDQACVQHDTGPGHPERARRLQAALDGVTAAALKDAVVALEMRSATLEELARVHPPEYLDALQRFCAAGGGAGDPDTAGSAGAWRGGGRAPPAGLGAPRRKPGGGGGGRRPRPGGPPRSA